MYLIGVCVVLLAGAMLPLQAGINSHLARFSGSALWASAISFMIGCVALIAVNMALRTTTPSMIQLKDAPAWAWIGGLLGAFFVTAMAMFAPKLGASTLVALVIGGQLVTAVLLDHFGLAGYEVSETSLTRIAGLVLVGVGAYLTHRF
ncbi:DMT family transporter [Neptuniibacter halophilus]|uniref:DMT family transporter n=1 Tax=Neptuniibacter halophilus TaxID=651666 RepID=UPI0025726870|nr:DMT family transporter [Neptuniibacter halophilus]